MHILLAPKEIYYIKKEIQNTHIEGSFHTFARKNLSFSGHSQKTKGLANNFDKKKHEEAPAVAEKTTKISPFNIPNRAPARREKNIVPGIINVCMNM